LSERDVEEAIERIWRGESLRVRYGFPDGCIELEIGRQNDSFRVRRYHESYDANSPSLNTEEDWERASVARWLGEMGQSIVLREFGTRRRCDTATGTTEVPRC
jgi:hypothetical protein